MSASKPSEVMQQAADWVVQLRSPERSTDCEQLFADWLRASPLHVREYLRAVEVWEGLAHPHAGGRWSPEELIREAASSNLVELPLSGARDSSQGHITQALEPRGLLRRLRVGFVAALAVFALTYFGWRWSSASDVKTGLGEQHSAVLPDHSLVELNTQSEIRIAFTKAERRVELVRGEAFFDVAADPQRPFVVVTDLATAKAVGTRFSVYRTQTGTIVTVAEGRVLVREKQANTASAVGVADQQNVVEVVPGTQAEARPGRPVQMRQANIERTFAWRERRLVFDGEPLEAVVEEFNRYNSPPLVITDPRLRGQRISGVFGANDPGSLLDFLMKVDHIAITNSAGGAKRIGGAQADGDPGDGPTSQQF